MKFRSSLEATRQEQVADLPALALQVNINRKEARKVNLPQRRRVGVVGAIAPRKPVTGTRCHHSDCCFSCDLMHYGEQG